MEPLALPAAHVDPAMDQALDWFVTLASGEVSAQERQDFQRWLDAAEAHRQAWDTMRGFQSLLQGMPSAAAGHALREGGAASSARGGRIRVSRRQALAVVGALALGAMAYRRRDMVLELAADERSATGQQRQLQLPDGSRVVLDTASAVDIRFDGRVRRLVLRSGAVMVETAHSDGWRDQPFVVETRQGTVLALGTRFTVRQLPGAGWWQGPGQVEVAVLEGTVELAPAAARQSGAILRTGQQARFDAEGAAAAQPLDANAQAWAQGMLIVRDQPLGDFIADLARYRSGVLQCDEQAAALRVSGVFPLEESERILDALERALPVKVTRHTRYWVSLSAK